MRKTLAILLCKLAKKIGSYVGRGSSLPGKIALKICPDVLSKVWLPKISIAISGSNGKTSTAEMISGVLERSGMSVGYNREGSNQIEGVATMILCNCNIFGRFMKDALVMEVDERYAKYLFSYITPSYYVINNLYRDQLTRNGSPEYVFRDIEKSIVPGSVLVLNSDDPLVCSLGDLFNNEKYYFGINDNQYVSEECDSVYDDGYYCPVCKSRMIYEYRHFAHIGKYKCTNCSFARKDPDYYISDIDLSNSEVVINRQYYLYLAFNSIFNAYNVLACFTVASLVGIDIDVITETLNDYLIKNGRIRQFKINDQDATLLISKHENSISYNRDLDYIASYDGNVTLMILIDDISRKYFTSDTSWLWDISFEKLNSDNIKQIIICGKYIFDVYTRLEYAGVDMPKVVMRKDTHDAIEYLKIQPETDNIFVMTCFSDEDKIFKALESEQ